MDALIETSSTLEKVDLFAEFQFASLFKKNILNACANVFSLPSIGNNPVYFDVIKKVLLQEIDSLVERSIIYELNACALSKSLRGNLPKERYRYFMDQSSSPSTIDFFLRSILYLRIIFMRCVIILVNFFSNLYNVYKEMLKRSQSICSPLNN